MDQSKENQQQTPSQVKEAVQAATDAFWLEFTEKFPEVTSGDSQLSGEDEGAMHFWLTGQEGDYPTQVFGFGPPSGVPAERFASVVSSAINAAGDALRRFNPGLPATPASAHARLEDCMRHVLRWNFPGADEE